MLKLNNIFNFPKFPTQSSNNNKTNKVNYHEYTYEKNKYINNSKKFKYPKMNYIIILKLSI